MASVRSKLPFPAYLPDQLPGNVLTVAENVYPAADGYRAVKGPQTISEALPAGFLGGFSAIATDGTVILIAGTANGLMKLDVGSWGTLLTALSISQRWRFAQFGDHVVTVNGGATQDVDIIAGTASALDDAPSGDSVFVVGDHVVITNSNGDNQRVDWSAFNNHTGWTPGVDQSGFQPMLTGGEIKGGAGGEYGVVLQRFRLVRMERTGDATAPFNFAEITTNVGCAASGSIAQAGRTVFFLSDRGFMALEDGTALKPIGNERFDQSFRDTVSTGNYERLWSAVDPKRSLVFWGVDGKPGRLWCYNWVLDRPTTLSLPFSGFFAGYTTSLTLEQLSTLYPNLDTMPFSLDDSRFQGGDPRLYFVDADRKLAALSGPNLAAKLQLGFVEPAGGAVARLRGVWPVTDAADGVTITVDARQRLGDGEGEVSSAALQRSGRAPLRARGKFMSFGEEIEAGATWTYTKGLELEVTAGGNR